MPGHLPGFAGPVTAPRVGMTGVTRQWGGHERTGINGAYVRAAAQAGLAPIILSPLTGTAAIPDLVSGLHALMLTGGEDVAPERYGASPLPVIDAPDPVRDAFEVALFEAARSRGLPVLGICRGIQLINVAMGGTLWQDLPSERPSDVAHDPGGARQERSHVVRIAAASLAARVLGSREIRVNSIHHQGVRELAPGLVASGWAEDGLIEAVEDAVGSWLLAVQWHPEEMHADVTAPERRLFVALREAAIAAVAAAPADRVAPAKRTVGKTPGRSRR